MGTRSVIPKAALLAAIAQLGFVRLHEMIQQVMSEWSDDPKTQIIETGKGYVRLAVSEPEMTQLMFGGILNPETLSEEYCEVSQRSFSSLLEVLENGEKRKLYKPADCMERALAMWSMAHGLAMLASAGQLSGVVDNQEQLDHVAKYVGKVLLEGLLK